MCVFNTQNPKNFRINNIFLEILTEKRDKNQSSRRTLRTLRNIKTTVFYLNK